VKYVIKRALSLLLSAALAVSTVAAPVLAAEAEPVVVHPDYAVNVELAKDSSITFAGQDTLKISFQIKTGANAKIATLQYLNLTYDYTLFEPIYREDGWLSADAYMSVGLESFTEMRSFVYGTWNGGLSAGKSADGKLGYLSLQPNRELGGAFQGLSLPDFTTMESVNLALRAGRTFADIKKDSVRLMSLDAETNRETSQTSIVVLTDGTTPYDYYGTENDTLQKPTFSFKGFEIAKSPLTVPAVALAANPLGGLTVTVTDAANHDEDIASYRVQLYDAAGSEPVGSAFTVDKDELTVNIPLSANITSGASYTAKVRVIAADGSDYADSNWSTLSSDATAAYAPLAFAFDGSISDSQVGVAIDAVDVSGGVTGGLAPYTFAAEGLSDGITIDPATGVISGIPATANTEGGTAIITVKDSAEEPASASIQLVFGAVAKGVAEISGTAAYQKTYGDDPFELTGISVTGDGELHYAIAADDASGSLIALDGATVTIKGAGTAKVYVTAAASDNYAAVTEPYAITITVNKAAAAITGTQTYTKTPNDAAFTLDTQVSGDGILAYELISGTDVVALGEETGFVTILGVGTATIHVTAAAGTNNAAVTDSYVVTITVAAEPLTGTIHIHGTPKYGEALTAAASLPANAKNLSYTWFRVQDDDVQVVGDGNTYAVTAADVGAVLRVEAQAANYSGSIHADTVTVAKAQYTGAAISAGLVEVVQGVAQTNVHYHLTRLALPSSFHDVQYEAVVIDEDGNDSALLTGTPSIDGADLVFAVTAQEAGVTGTLTVTISSRNYEDITVKIQVKTVEKALAAVTLIVPENHLVYGALNQLNPLSGATVSVIVDDEETLVPLEGAVFNYRYQGIQADGTPYGPSATAPVQAGEYTVLASLDHAYYLGEAETGFTISPKSLAWNTDLGVLGIATTKVYDRTTTARVNGVLTLDGVLTDDRDDVSLSYAAISALFSDAEVGNRTITVTVEAPELTGALAHNYTLPANTTVLSDLAGTITAPIGDIVDDGISEDLYTAPGEIILVISDLDASLADSEEEIDSLLAQIKDSFLNKIKADSEANFQSFNQNTATLRFFDLHLEQNGSTISLTPGQSIPLILPYPNSEVANQYNQYTFLFLHYNADGTVSSVPVTATIHGLEATITDCSPFALAWTATSAIIPPVVDPPVVNPPSNSGDGNDEGFFNQGSGSTSTGSSGGGSAPATTVVETDIAETDVPLTDAPNIGPDQPAISQSRTISKADLNYIYGQNRVLTAIEISKNWPSAHTVILAPGAEANLIDALTVAPLAYQENAPILLSIDDTVDAAVAAEISRLGAAKVILVGALSENVVAQLRTLLPGLTVETLRGQDRFATADLINARVTTQNGTFIVGYNALADAVSAASYAAANGYIIQIAQPDGSFSGNTALGGYILGGPTLVADISGFTRLFGIDRYVTNKVIRDTLHFEYTYIFTADGGTLVDALTGSVLAAQSRAAIVLTPGNDPTGVDFGNITDATIVKAFGGAK
jgi:hypothetical protein